MTLPGRLTAYVALGVALLWPIGARADDTADEADLHFMLGAEAYQRGEHRLALEHFLASNRLVPNKNVLFNIARSYEQLDQFPEAFRYYKQALEGETDPAARTKIETALAQIADEVAVINVVTTPPGATLYVDRKDLGPRGESPRALGLSPGKYHIIAELPGYEPAAVVIDDVKIGQEKTVKLELRPLLGSAQIEGPKDAAVRVDGSTTPVRCHLPCKLDLSVGRHTLFVERPGFRTAELEVEMRVRETLLLQPRFEALTGSVVISSDEPGARIEIDGKTSGFTPALVNLPVGKHRLHISLSGFRSVQRSIEVKAGAEQKIELNLTRSQEVLAASRVSEPLENAPSSVTVVSRQELRAFAYPTIAEALRGTPGVYLWDDRSYVAVGIRGLGRLGSYGNRVLVLYDGEPTNDNWLGSSYVGYDALSDLGDVQRIEVVRGPGSALYGTNAFSGVVNLVSRDAAPGAEIGIGTNQYGVARARARADAKLGSDATIWTSVAAARSEGRDFYFPEYDTAETGGGRARGADGFEAGTVRGRARYRWLSLQWSMNSHSKRLPTGAYETAFADARTRQTDTRAFVEARAEPRFGNLQSLTRLHANVYRFRGVYARDPMDGGVEIDTYKGQWVGLEQRFVWDPAAWLRLSVGGEGQIHYQVEQTAHDESGYFLDSSDPYQIGAAYVVGDAAVGSNLRVSAGARLDAYSTFGLSVNPRAALIAKPYERGNLKLLAGTAFRAPSVYELGYNDGGVTQVASPDLKPESIQSLELEHSHRFSSTITGTLSAYANYVSDLIVSEGSGDEVDPIHYMNSDTPLASLGCELGLRRDWRQGYMVSASYGFSQARFLEDDTPASMLSLDRDPTKREVANAPAHLASFKAAVPIVGRALLASTRLTLEGPRYDRFEDVGSDPQGQTDGAVIWDIVVSGEEPRFNLSYAFGVYNAFNWRYSAPASAEFTQRTIPQDGRTFLASGEMKF